MSDNPPAHIIKKISDKLKKLGASEVDRIEVVALVEEIYRVRHEDGYEDCCKEHEDAGDYQ